MNNRQLALGPTSVYNEFLFASVYEEANGTPLSVLSALARNNIDPWEEAALLAAMPRETAETTLASILDVASARSRKSSEIEAIATRLVRLLPRRIEGGTAALTEIAGVHAQRTSFSLVWICFAIALSLISARHHATTADAGTATTPANSVFQSETHAASNTLPVAKDEPH
ncbi:hypothetical protein RHPLAN_12640 [Rhodoplanes sp. Z2-YC6860]|nr:hypothetical protein RHPLAN_12640 [Rhodoplanes sp. Z2-YC6860]